jgi:hypothetical protein
VVRLIDWESGLSARTIARCLSSVSGLCAYLVARGDTPVRTSPVPRGLLTRRPPGLARGRRMLVLAICCMSLLVVSPRRHYREHRAAVDSAGSAGPVSGLQWATDAAPAAIARDEGDRHA